MPWAADCKNVEHDYGAYVCSFRWIVLPAIASGLQKRAKEGLGGWAAAVTSVRAFLERIESAGTSFVPSLRETFRAIDKHQLHAACQAFFGEADKTLVGPKKGPKYSVEKLPAVPVCSETMAGLLGRLKELQPLAEHGKYVVKPAVGGYADGISIVEEDAVEAACLNLCGSQEHACACSVEPFNGSLAQAECRIFVLGSRAAFMVATHSSAPGIIACEPMPAGHVSLPWAAPPEPWQPVRGTRKQQRLQKRQQASTTPSRVVHNQEMRLRLDAAAEKVAEAMHKCAAFSDTMHKMFMRVDLAMDAPIDDVTSEVTNVVLVNEIELFQRAHLFLKSPKCGTEQCKDKARCPAQAKERLQEIASIVIKYMKTQS